MVGSGSDDGVFDARGPRPLPAASAKAVDQDHRMDNAWLQCADLLTRAQHLTTCAFMACASLDDLDQATALETVLCSIEDLLADVQRGLAEARERNGLPFAGPGPATSPFVRPPARTAPIPAPVG